MVVCKDGKILLERRARPPRRGQWSLPGGTVELGETVREAAIREMHEEFSIEVEIEKILDVIDRIFRDAQGRVQYHFVLVEFLARYKSGELRRAADIGAAEWADPENLQKYGLPPDQVDLIRRTAIERGR
jgi:mutator protein MutT